MEDSSLHKRLYRSAGPIINITMIRILNKKGKDKHISGATIVWQEYVFATLMFISLTFFFFFSFLNISFDTIVTYPPLGLMLVMFAILTLDIIITICTEHRLTFSTALNIIITILLFLSWIMDNNYVIFLSSSIFLRFPEIVMFNDLILDNIGRLFSNSSNSANDIFYKIYTVLRIFYMMAIVGHVLGCIFYVIDHLLIKAEYFGSLQENPSLYYQGELVCFSPIYSLSQETRYIYCMYYIFSLLATVAYGDIIPKNHFQNLYVVFLLVLSTISISIIIEQMYTVFRKDKIQFFQIRYCSSLI